MFRENDKIGSYTLVRKLGRGAFGVVWLAEERTLVSTHTVALKLPNGDDIDIETIRQEAALWENVKGHPNILPIIKADIVEDQIYIASEYASDGSLSSWLKQHGGKAPSIEAAVEMMKGILSGLAHLHSKRVIHRDLKPDNILLQANTPRIADFGISRLLRTTVASTNAAGTPSYMAPECFDGDRSEMTDLWAAGVIFYQLLTGRLPFPQTDSISLMSAILTREPEIESGLLPEGLEPVIRKMLEKDPGRRFQSAEEIYAALRDAKSEKTFDFTKSGNISGPIHSAETVKFESAIATNESSSSKYKTTPIEQGQESFVYGELKKTLPSPKTEVSYSAPSTNQAFTSPVREKEKSNKFLFVGIAGVVALFIVIIASISLYLVINAIRPKTQNDAPSGPINSVENFPKGVKVDLPRDMNNPTTGSAILGSASIIVVIPNNNEFYINKVRISKEAMGNEIASLTRDLTGENRIVYIAAGVGVDYSNVVDAIKMIRKVDFDNIAFIAGKKNSTAETPYWFQLKIPAEPTTNENLKPNPLTLVVSIADDGKIRLNNDDVGNLSDLSALEIKLAGQFKLREENGVLREGTNIVEKTVFIKTSRSSKYGDVVKLIDSVKGTGAEPIGLQIDDLPGAGNKADSGGANGNKIYEETDVTSKAIITLKPQPEYTEEARKNQVQGLVKVRAVLSSSGAVMDIRALNSLPYGLTEKAIEAARNVQFNPATKDGRKVSQYTTLEYDFQLYGNRKS